MFNGIVDLDFIFILISAKEASLTLNECHLKMKKRDVSFVMKKNEIYCMTISA